MRPWLFLGVALGLAESVLLPQAWPLRLGLANIATLLAAIHGLRPAVSVAVLRAVVVGAATGALLAPAGIFSLAGGLVSAIVMAALLRLPLSLVFVSAVGGAFSSATQVVVFGALSGVTVESVLSLLPWFLAWGVVSGACSGLVAQYLVKAPRVPRVAEAVPDWISPMEQTRQHYPL